MANQISVGMAGICEPDQEGRPITLAAPALLGWPKRSCDTMLIRNANRLGRSSKWPIIFESQWIEFDLP
jgi:hypothetical protein